MRVLVQRADRLGDFILSLPVMESLIQAFPDLSIGVLISPISVSIANAHPAIKTIHVIDWKKNTISEFFRLKKEISEKKYDGYISLWNNPWMAYLGFFCKIPKRIGDSSVLALKWLYTDTVDQRWPHYSRHQIEFNLDLLRPLGIANPKPVIRFRTERDFQLNIPDKYSTVFLTKRKKMFIFCDSGGSNLAIPEEVILDFIHRIQNETRFSLTEGLQIVMAYGFQGPSEKMKRLTGDNLVNITDPLSLEELTGVITGCDFYVGPDTGPTHIASFLNKPILLFSGKKSNPPVRWGPRSDYFIILREEFLCPHFCPKVRCGIFLECRNYLTGEKMAASFLKLILCVERGIKFSETKKQKALQLSSFRVAAICWSRSEWERIKNCVEALREKGLMIFPVMLDNRFKIRSIFKLIHVAKRRNVNVLHGKILPFWMTAAVRFYFGIFLVYIRPIIVKTKFSSKMKLNDYLALYTHIFEHEP